MHWFGHRPFDLVPAYIKGLDVCMMCYVINNWTFYGDPSKLHEYLASGKPTIGTGLPSIREFADVVQIPETPQEWVAAVDRALAGDATRRSPRAASRPPGRTRIRPASHAFAPSSTTRCAGKVSPAWRRPRYRRTHMTTDIRSSDQPLVSVVVPCFNEEDVIAETYRRLAAVLGGSGQARFELIFVNDGSRDRTLELLRGIQAGDPTRARRVVLAQLRPPDGRHRRHRPRRRRRGRADRRRPAGSARGHARDARALARRRRRRLRRARRARRRDRDQAVDGEVLLSPDQRHVGHADPARHGRLPADGSPRGRRAAGDARARPLRARHGVVGRLPAGAGALPTRRRASPAPPSTR